MIPKKESVEIQWSQWRAVKAERLHHCREGEAALSRQAAKKSGEAVRRGEETKERKFGLLA